MANLTADLAAHGTLVGATVDTVTLQYPGASLFEVVNRDATSTIFVTYSKSGTPATPTVGGNDTFVVPPNSAKQLAFGLTGASNLVVKLISSGTPAYSVEILA